MQIASSTATLNNCSGYESHLTMRGSLLFCDFGNERVAQFIPKAFQLAQTTSERLGCHASAVGHNSSIFLA
jgi:hypothetical protein